MLKKNYSKTGSSCRVTFKVPADANAVPAESAVAVLGDWNGWRPEAHRLQRRKDGSFSTTLSLEAGRSYRFRYLLDGSRFVNDEQPDELVPNRFGAHDCLISL